MAQSLHGKFLAYWAKGYRFTTNEIYNIIE